MINWIPITASISHATQTRFELADAMPLAGGCINQAWRINNRSGQHYFVKLNDAAKLPMFAAESAGLSAIAATHSVRVPQPIAHGTADEHAYLVLEYLALQSSGNEALLGTQLAALHRMHSKEFGWPLDNTLGETPQPNKWTADWITFWREQRLGFQLDLAARNGYGGELQTLGKQLMERLPEFF